MKRMLAFVPFLFVAGCDQSWFSTGTTQGSNEVVSQSVSLDKTKSAGISDKQVRTIDYPVQLIISEAIDYYVNYTGENVTQNLHEYAFSCVDDVFELIKSAPTSGFDLSLVSAKAKAMKTENPGLLKTVCFGGLLNVLTNPISGWSSISPKNEDMNRFLEEALALADVYEDLAMGITDSPLATKTEYVDRAKSLLLENHENYRLHFLAARQAKAVRQFTADFTGHSPAPVHFITSDGYDYQRGDSIRVTKNGTEIFSSTKIKAKEYTLTAIYESAISIAKSKTLTNENNQINKSESASSIGPN